MAMVIFQIQTDGQKVGIVERKGCADISVYSNRLEKTLGWYAKKGSKFVQKVSVPNWIKENKQYSIHCLRGLLETYGSIYNDRGYKMVGFTLIVCAIFLTLPSLWPQRFLYLSVIRSKFF